MNASLDGRNFTEASASKRRGLIPPGSLMHDAAYLQGPDYRAAQDTVERRPR